MLAFTLLLCSSLLAQSFDSTWTDTIYPGGDGAAGEKWITIRVVDKLSGAPIPQAQLMLMSESTPVGGQPIQSWWDVADEDGFVSMRVDEGAVGFEPWGWLCVRAPGYCQHMRMRAFDDEIVPLSPSIAVPVQIRDWRNQPVEDVLVGFCSGCGHTPDLVHGVTGKGGLTTLPGVDIHQGIADFYAVHPDLVLGYDSPLWAPGKQPMVMRLPAGVVHRGVVVDHEGVPVGGAAVGCSIVNRGPWALTKADGTFEVCGLDSACDLTVMHNNRQIIFACMGTEGLRLQIPKANGDRTVVVEVSEEACELDELRREQQQGLAELREAAWPKALVRTVGMPKDGMVFLRTKHKLYRLDDLIETGQPVSIPDDEFVFELRGDDDCERIIPGDREQILRDGLVRLHWFADTMVEGRLVDAQGRMAHAMLRIEPLLCNPDNFQSIEQEVYGAISIPVRLEGLHWLVIRERLTGATRKMPIDLPLRGENAFLDLGDVCLRERSMLTVRGPDGTPLKNGDVIMRRLGFPDWAFERSNDQWWGPDLKEGDYVTLAADLEPPKDLGVSRVLDVSSRFKVEGRGPWTFQQHAGEILFDIDADGASVGVTVDEHFVKLDQATLLRGLAPGVHQVFISGVGRRSAIVDIEVPVAGKGRAHLKMALPARQ